MEDKIKYMKAALRAAERALKIGEVPIGAVVVYEGKIIGRGYNRRLKTQLASAHAEMMAIDAACKKLGSWRLPGAEIYVTLEPCPMCMGAILNARIDKLYFGAYEQKGRSFTNELSSANLLNHTVEVEGGVLQEKCSGIITKFFSDMREREKLKKSQKESEE
ncbi:MAG: nucleoside deaminase [Clostridia bacterium]|nr:nucleoside deaminase [Clostridia bacterium]